MTEIKLERPEPPNLQSNDENLTELDNSSTESDVKSKHLLLLFLFGYFV